MFPKDLRFTDLINPVDWQNIQDSLSEVLDITLRTFSPNGELLTKASRTSRLLTEIFPKVHKISSLCGKCLLKSRVEEIKNITKDTNIKCPFDIDVFIIPIKSAGDAIIAYLVLGPVILSGRKSLSEYSKEAKEFGIKTEELADALIEIGVFSFNRVNAVIKLIKSIFSYIARSEYHKRRLGEIRPEVVELDPLFSRYYEEKILNALLNSCTLALDADSGSVMTVDKKTRMLHIKAASKLDEKIVDTTNQKWGEGIAGIAAATAESIVLPKDKDKKGISAKMTRGYIKSSMIVPFNRGASDDVYGVINLNITRKEKEFSDKDISIVKELVNMAGTALAPIRKE